MTESSTDPSVRASLEHCRAVARRHARNFYHGMRLTPEPRRSALFVVYAWMRAADELGDGPVPVPEGRVGPDLRPRLTALASFRQQTTRAMQPGSALPGDDPMWPAFRYVARTFGLPEAALHGMLDGQRDDLLHSRYATFEELYRYCYRVASTVGQVCVHLWGHDGDPGVAKLAEYRGIALQLTNILRDLAEDARRGRRYLPAEDLERFGVAEDDLLGTDAPPGFERLMRFQVARARSYYEMSASLDRHVAPDCRPSSRAIMRVYRELLTAIEQNPAAVLRKRVRVAGWRKARAVGAAFLRR